MLLVAGGVIDGVRAAIDRAARTRYETRGKVAFSRDQRSPKRTLFPDSIYSRGNIIKRLSSLQRADAARVRSMHFHEREQWIALSLALIN